MSFVEIEPLSLGIRLLDFHECLNLMVALSVYAEHSCSVGN